MAWEWTTVGSEGRKQAEERWAITGPGRPQALREALELEGSSRLSQFAERGPGAWTPLHTERFQEASCCSGRRGYNLSQGSVGPRVTHLAAGSQQQLELGESHSPEGSCNDITVAIICAHVFIFPRHQCLNLLWYRFCMLRLKIMESNFLITWNNWLIP